LQTTTSYASAVNACGYDPLIAELENGSSPLAQALARVGNRWTLLVVERSGIAVVPDAARSLALTGTPASLGAAAAWTGGLLAVFIPLSVWRYRRIS